VRRKSGIGLTKEGNGKKISDAHVDWDMNTWEGNFYLGELILKSIVGYKTCLGFLSQGRQNNDGIYRKL